MAICAAFLNVMASRRSTSRPRECMTPNPQTIGPDEFAIAALEVMERRKITALPVVDPEGRLLGVVHLHDLWGTQMV